MKTEEMQFVETLYMRKKQSQISDFILLWDISLWDTRLYFFLFRTKPPLEQEEKEQT